MTISTSPLLAAGESAFMSPSRSALNGCLVLPLGVLGRQRLDAVEGEQRAGSTSAARTRACRRCRRPRCARRAARSRGRPPWSPSPRNRRSPASPAVVPRREAGGRRRLRRGGSRSEERKSGSSAGNFQKMPSVDGHGFCSSRRPLSQFAVMCGEACMVRWIPSFRIRLRRVFGLSPRMSAAP